ncbi:hypothetical protein NE237_014201 [Protea cynaroides]|uniref:Uncharacterized protein n=1 Tax=Protea cynaroides TaxID=273540 RepID=A0A9Q0GP95_9MAGN|nr:hypothetical protein NE237_014201 [Protea cynaroides]
MSHVLYASQIGRRVSPFSDSRCSKNPVVSTTSSASSPSFLKELKFRETQTASFSHLIQWIDVIDYPTYLRYNMAVKLKHTYVARIRQPIVSLQLSYQLETM